MPIAPLADLVTPGTPADILTLELGIATALGLQTSTWQPLDPSRTLFQINAVITSGYSSTVNLIAQGGYASYAAQMVSSSGAPITTWMDLIGNDNYNLPRQPATSATGPVPFTNTSANAYAYSPNQPLKFQNPITPNATYTSIGTGTLGANSSGTIQITADAAFVGPAGSAAIGTILVLLTPKSGVTIGAQTVALVGSSTESNSAYLARCQAKLGTLSALSQLAAIVGTTTPVPAAPGGSALAYFFVATTIPQASVASAVWPFAVTATITRETSVTFGGGVVNVFIANSSGAPSGTDVAVVQAAVNLLVTPQGITALVQAATNLAIAISYTVYIHANGPLSNATITANIATALAAYISQIPIGGLSLSGVNVVPIDAILATIFNANAGTINVVINSPVDFDGKPQDIVLTSSQVPVLGPLTANVVQV
jgi:hypothetical protein